MPLVHSGGAGACPSCQGFICPEGPAPASVSVRKRGALPGETEGTDALTPLKPRSALSVIAQNRPAGSQPWLPQESNLRASACPGQPVGCRAASHLAVWGPASSSLGVG